MPLDRPGPPRGGGRAAIERRVVELAEPVTDALGLELVDVEFVREGGQSVLRVRIDRPQGITHAECEAVSHRLSDALDEVDPIPGPYVLEVSSPGIERPLKRDADFERFAGRLATVHAFAPVEGRRRWTGVLGGLDGDGRVLLRCGDREVAIPRDQVSRAHLAFDPEFEFRRGRTEDTGGAGQ